MLRGFFGYLIFANFCHYCSNVVGNHLNLFYFSFDSGASEIPRGISNVRSYSPPWDTVGRTSRMRQNPPGKGDYLFADFSFAAGDVISAEAACRQGEMIHWHVLRVECPQLTQFYLLF